MRAYTGQPTATQFSGLRHVRLHSTRPPASPELVAFNKMSEDTCAKSQPCQHSYRDRADIYVTAAELLREVAAAGKPAPAPAPNGGPSNPKPDPDH